MSKCEEQEEHVKRLADELEVSIIGINNRDKHVKRLADELVDARESLRVAVDERKTAIDGRTTLQYMIDDKEAENAVLRRVVEGIEELKVSIDKKDQTTSKFWDADLNLLAEAARERDGLMKTNVALERNLEHAQGCIRILEKNSERLVNQRDAARRKAEGFFGRLFRRIRRKGDNGKINSAG